MKVRALAELVLGALRTAVTPLGTPETVNATLAARPTGVPTVMVLLTFAPPTRRVMLLADDVRLKLGAGMVKLRTVELDAVAELPLTVTA